MCRICFTSLGGVPLQKGSSQISPATLTAESTSEIRGAENGDYCLATYLVIEDLARSEVEMLNLKLEIMTDALLNDTVDAVSTWNAFKGSGGQR
jgi:hypothetical protein